MKAILEFQLPEDTIDHNDALNGYKYRDVLYEFYNDSLRRRLKYVEETLPKEAVLLEQLWEELRQLLQDRGLEL